MRGYQLSAICNRFDNKIKPYFRGLFNSDTTDEALEMLDFTLDADANQVVGGGAGNCIGSDGITAVYGHFHG